MIFSIYLRDFGGQAGGMIFGIFQVLAARWRVKNKVSI
jgi:hypothetical protein